MKLNEINAVADAALAAMQAQDKYVQELGKKITAGEKTIRIFDESLQTWTEVRLTDFWQIQYDKYLAMAGYSGDLAQLVGNLEAALKAGVEAIPLPIDRVKAQAAAKASA